MKSSKNKKSKKQEKSSKSDLGIKLYKNSYDNYTKSCSPVSGSINAASSAKNKPNIPMTDAMSGYVFIIRIRDNFCESNRWGFVEFSYGTTLRVASNVTNVFPEVTDEIKELWKRIAIDNVFEWDANVDIKSLRLLKINISCEDATSKLFDDDEETMEEQCRMAILASLSSSEAKLLNQDNKHVILRLTRDSTPSQKDYDLSEYMRSNKSFNLLENIFPSSLRD